MNAARVLAAVAVCSVVTADAQENAPRSVRVVLVSGEELKGELVEFADRVWRVRLADGSVRSVPEASVRQLAFLPSAQAGAEPESSDVVFRSLLRAAQKDGSLERLLGVRHFRVRQHRTREGGGERLELDGVLRVEVSREGNELRVGMQLYPGPESRKPEMRPLLAFRAAGACHYEARLGLRDARFLGSAGWSKDLERSMRVDASGDLEVSETELRRSGTVQIEQEWKVGVAQQVDEASLCFVLGPLYAASDAGPCTLRLIRPGRADSPRKVTRLHRLPTADGSLRLELRTRLGDSEDPSRSTLAFDSAGRVTRLEGLDYSRTGESTLYHLERRVVVTALDDAASAEQLAAWGLELGVPKPVQPEFPPLKPSPRDAELGQALLAAVEEGCDRWFMGEAGEERVLVHVALTPTADGSELATEVARVGVAEGEQARLTFGPAGGLRAVRSATKSTDSAREIDVLVEPGATRSRAVSQIPSRRPEETTYVRPLERLPQALLSLLVLAPHLEPGDRTHSLTLLNPRSALGSDQPARLIAGSVDGGVCVLDGRPIAVPEGLPATRALGVVHENGGPLPISVFWLDGTQLVGWSEGVGEFNYRELAPAEGKPWVYPSTFLPQTADEVARLRDDPAAKAAHAQREREGTEFLVSIYLEELSLVQESYRQRVAAKPRGFAGSYAELAEAGLVKGDSTRQGAYRLVVQRSAQAPGKHWVGVAEPLDPSSGYSWLAVDERGKAFKSEAPIRVGPDARLPEGLTPAR